MAGTSVYPQVPNTEEYCQNLTEEVILLEVKPACEEERERCEEDLKQIRSKDNFAKFGRGTSNSSRKRKAVQVGPSGIQNRGEPQERRLDALFDLLSYIATVQHSMAAHLGITDLPPIPQIPDLAEHRAEDNPESCSARRSPPPAVYPQVPNTEEYCETVTEEVILLEVKPACEEERERCEKDLKQIRSNENFAKFCRGTSKSVAKKRAEKVGRCWKCGALKHTDACKESPTTSELEFVRAFRMDPVLAEGTLTPNSDASKMIHNLLSSRKSKLERKLP